MGRWILKQDGYGLLTQSGKYLQGDDLTVNSDELVGVVALDHAHTVDTLQLKVRRWRARPLMMNIVEGVGARGSL